MVVVVVVVVVWLGTVAVRKLDLWSAGHEFNSRPLHYRAATLHKLLTHVPSTSEFTTIWHYRNVINFNVI